MYTSTLIAPTPRRITALVTWFVPQVPMLAAATGGPPQRRPPPPPPRKAPVYVPPPPQRWDQPLPDPMGMALADEWETEQKNKPTRSAETPRLS